MSLIYQSLLGSFSGSLTLATLLLPGAALMSYGINYFKRAQSSWRWLHLFYILLFSLYVEWLGIIAAYWLVFELEYANLPKVVVNPVFLWLYMLFFTLVQDYLFPRPKATESSLEEPLWFEITSERQKQQIDLRKLLYVESRNDQTFFHLSEETLPSRERISKIAERLPAGFLRIHRSFIINPSAAISINSQEVQMPGAVLSVSRSYRPQLNENLQGQSQPKEA